MREILFRGKRFDNGKWVDGSAVWFDEGQCFIMPPYPGASSMSYAQLFALTAVMVDPATVGQYTGLTDKNGAKIFEGDCIHDYLQDLVGVIRYGEYCQPFDDYKFSGHIGFYVDWIFGSVKDRLQKDLGYWHNRVYIIGNIHDNPELLEGSAENG